MNELDGTVSVLEEHIERAWMSGYSLDSIRRLEAAYTALVGEEEAREGLRRIHVLVTTD